MGDALAVDRAVDFFGIEGRVDVRGYAVDDALEEDAEAANVKKRQANEPAVIVSQAEVQCRPDRAPKVIAVGKHRPFWPARRSGRVNNAMYSVEVNGVG